MKDFPSKPKHPAIVLAIRQSPFISAAAIQTCSSLPEEPAPTYSKSSKPAQLPDFDSLPSSGFVRLPTLLQLFACSRATIWRWVKAGKLPPPYSLGPKIAAWNVGQLKQAIAAHLHGGNHG